MALPIFSKIKSDELCYLESAIYNYDCSHSTINYYYNTYPTIWEDPQYKAKAYMKVLLAKFGKDTNEIISAFSFYIIITYIIIFKKTEKDIKKRGIIFI
jgi:hypothetical protein